MSSLTSLTGAAGEHYVMFELLSRGMVGALAPEGIPNLDIVVTSVDGTQLSSLQVKSRWAKGRDGGWHMSKKHEEIVAERLFYCFVDLRNEPDDKPISYIVPSEIVAKTIRETHIKWLNSPGKNGHIRKDSSFRRFLPDYSSVYQDEKTPYPSGWLDPYRNKWSQLINASQTQENGK